MPLGHNNSFNIGSQWTSKVEMPCKRTRKTGFGLKNALKRISVPKIFTDEQENNILDYIVTITESWGLIYEVAMLNKIKVPDKWHWSKLAGIEYLVKW